MSPDPSQGNPPQPAYVLRGHGAAIHATAFIRANSRLVTGDADGWVVVWSLATRRPTAAWRAHEPGAGVLGVATWGEDKIITHGKDNKLIVWRLSEADETDMSTALPVDELSPASGLAAGRQPWLLHVLLVNTMNFCAFGYCLNEEGWGNETEEEGGDGEILIAVPNTMGLESVDIFHLPSGQRRHTVNGPSTPTQKTGLVMTLSLFHHPTTSALTLLTGHESGHTAVSALDAHTGQWNVRYVAHPHSQPLLSLSPLPDRTAYFTSSADALLVRHPIPDSLPTGAPLPRPSTQAPESSPFAPGAGGIGGLFSTLNQNSPNTTNSEVNPHSSNPPTTTTTTHTAHPETDPSRPSRPTPAWQINTRHAGQQGLTVRDDGRLLATAGWDGRARLYATKAGRELAVLKWHREGCYAVAFAGVSGTGEGSRLETSEDVGGEGGKRLTVRQRRAQTAASTHWVALGGKDGKVSLWDVY